VPRRRVECGRGGGCDDPGVGAVGRGRPASPCPHSPSLRCHTRDTPAYIPTVRTAVCLRWETGWAVYYPKTAAGCCCRSARNSWRWYSFSTSFALILMHDHQHISPRARMHRYIQTSSTNEYTWEMYQQGTYKCLDRSAWSFMAAACNMSRCIYLSSNTASCWAGSGAEAAARGVPSRERLRPLSPCACASTAHARCLPSRIASPPLVSSPAPSVA